jgi:hypothetical protein
LGKLLRFFLHIDYILALCVADLSEGQEKRYFRPPQELLKKEALLNFIPLLKRRA